MNDGGRHVHQFLDQPGHNLGVGFQDFHVAVGQVPFQAVGGVGDHRVELLDGLLEGLPVYARHVVVGFDGQVLAFDGAVPEMVLIGLGLPGLDVVEDLRHVGHHFQEHDELVEMIQVIRRQQGRLVDVRALDPFLQGEEFVVTCSGVRWGVGGFVHAFIR